MVIRREGSITTQASTAVPAFFCWSRVPCVFPRKSQCPTTQNQVGNFAFLIQDGDPVSARRCCICHRSGRISRIPALARLARKRAQVAVNLTTPAGFVAMTFDASVDVIAPSVFRLREIMDTPLKFLIARNLRKCRTRKQVHSDS